MTRTAMAALLASLLSACGNDLTINVTANELKAADLSCESHGGVKGYNLPKPIDIYCNDGTHMRLYQ